MLNCAYIQLSLVAITLSTLAVQPAYGQPLNETFKLLPNDEGTEDRFGHSVAISGTTAVIGAPLNDDNGSDSGSAYVFDSETGQQLFKLLPSDGAADDQFGISVAISGTTAVVGAYLDDDNGSRSGSAYLFDTTTGQQHFKLLPSDGAAGDRFGISVAISGTTALIGAWLDDDNGSASGSAYLFDTTTGQQLFKLLPSDGAADDRFGHSVAITGTTAVVGAYLDDDNGSESGSAYLFDTTTGQQLFKLLPSDGAASDEFGISVAISGTTAVVGVYRSLGGTNVGSAYLFDSTTGHQIAELLDNDPSSNDFGKSVAICGTTTVVGDDAYSDNFNSGSAFLFDTTSGQKIAKLLPNVGELTQSFGNAVAICDSTVIVGSPRAVSVADPFDNPGAAFVFTVDSDRDGLPDDWERNGIPYTDSKGLQQRYILDSDGDGQSDANWLKKDIFVEVDAMTGRDPDEATLQRVVDAFDPFDKVLVPAVQGLSGGLPNVTLHIQASGDRSLMLTNGGNYGDPWTDPFIDFAVDKEAFFGTSTEREGPDAVARLEAKRKAYRYCIFANTYSGGSSSGVAQGIPSDDFMVTLGAFPTPGGTPDQQAATFMHELGHALGLGHGGGDNTHYKPNYYSVMNYWWQMPDKWQGSSWGLRYSEQNLPTLDENALSEEAGLGAMLPGVMVPYRVSNATICNGHFCWQNPQTQDIGCFLLAPFGPSVAVDWNGDCDPMTPEEVSADVNDLSFLLDADASLADQAAFGAGFTRLEGHNDWLNLHYNVRTTPTYSPGSSAQELYCQYDNDVVAFMSSIPPPPAPCLADVNGDGVVSPADFSAWIASFNTQAQQCDQNGDGLCTPADFSAWIANYNAGCN